MPMKNIKLKQWIGSDVGMEYDCWPWNMTSSQCHMPLPNPTKSNVAQDKECQPKHIFYKLRGRSKVF